MTDTARPPYPPNWQHISMMVRERSSDRCECEGECGLHAPEALPRFCKDPDPVRRPRRCTEVNGTPARWAKGKVVLTVAHLDHDPTNNSPRNLKAMCQRCHLRTDHKQHMRNRARTQDRKTGQARLPGAPK